MSEDDTPSSSSGRASFERRPYFGKGLRELRESYAQRLGRSQEQPILRARVSANELIACMQSQGFEISQSAYNDIENGYNVPRDPVGLIETVAVCLLLSNEDKEDLEERFAYDMLWARIREHADRYIRPKDHWGKPAGQA